MGDLLDRAIVFAVKAHSGMRRKGNSVPYILHPLEAAVVAATMTDDEEVIAAAVLHDVLEDTPVIARQLRNAFGERVTALVLAESEDKRADRPASETWKLRKQETVDALMREVRPEVKIIALSDKLSNLRTISQDYQKIGDRLWDQFNQKDKSEHGWYYRSIAKATKALSDFPAWQEYDALVKKLF
jgi:myo-inositol-1(or 4)-monophosphatase